MTFTGEINHAIHAASELVKKYYEMLARRMYKEAYELLSEQKRLLTNIIDLSHDVDTFESPYEFWRTMCTDIR